MLFYIIYFSTALCFSACVTYCKDVKYINLFKFLSFITIWLPVAFRYNVGNDYPNYVDIFDSISKGMATYIEPGYWWMNYIISKLDGNVQIVFALSSFIILFFFFKGVEKEKWFIYTLIFLLVIFVWYCSTIRQMMSASMAFYAWRQKEKGENFVAVLLIVFAFLFHYSSLIYPLLYLFAKKVKIGHLSGIILFIIALFMSFQKGDLLTSFLSELLSNTMYGNYTEVAWFQPVEMESGYGMLLRYFAYFIIIISFPLKESNRFIFSLFVCYIIIDIISIQVEIINRIGRGFIFIFLPCIYNIVSIHSRFRQISTLVVISIFTILLLKQMSVGYNYCIPYQSIFNK